MRLLLLALLSVLVFVSGCTSQGQAGNSHMDNLKPFEVAPSQLDGVMKEGGIKLLDVREQAEYDESHIDGTLLLSANSLTQENLDSLGLKKDDEIVVYCRSGSRSEKAYYVLKQLGYENVRSLGGGIIHWQEDGYPVVSGASSDASGEALTLDRKEHDFGQIPQFGGKVSTTFTLTNEGSSQVSIGQITTSCACTSAEADKEVLGQEESATVAVEFDPNLHEEPKDRFRRTVFIETSAGEVEATIWVDILEGM